MSYATSEWSSGSRSTSPDPGFSYAREPSPEERAEANAIGWVSIRNAALARLRKMIHGHIRIAVEPPKGRVPGPHALAYLYAYSSPNGTPGVPSYQVAAATRVVDDNEDSRPGHNVRELAYFLAGMADVAQDRIREGGFDPRSSMADRADDMPAAAGFVGIGVSSLGTPGEDWGWSRAAARANDGLAELNMPVTWRIRLVDGTRIEVSRHPGQMQELVRSSESLDPPRRTAYTGGSYLYGWSRLPDPYSPAPGSPDEWLDRLCLTIDEGVRTAEPSRRRR